MISVRDYTLGIEYDADDYTVEGRKIGVDPDGGMPYLRDFWLDGRSIPEELSDGVSPTLAAYSDGGGLNGGSHVVSEGSLTRTRHLAVTYAFDHTEQALGFEPQAYTPENFARFTAKLEAGEPVRILVLGDSIFVGMSASSMVGFEPQLPPFFDLIKNELAARFYGGDADMIELVNVSVGGETSDYGVQLVEGGETDLAGFDFVMIGFGMNDGTLNVAPAAFTDNIERMIDGIRLHSPDADFAVLGCFIPNPSSVFFGIQSSYIEPVRALTAQKNGEKSGCTYVGMYDISAAILGNKQQGETSLTTAISTSTSRAITPITPTTSWCGCMRAACWRRSCHSGARCTPSETSARKEGKWTTSSRKRPSSRYATTLTRPSLPRTCRSSGSSKS